MTEFSHCRSSTGACDAVEVGGCRHLAEVPALDPVNLAPALLGRAGFCRATLEHLLTTSQHFLFWWVY